MALLLKTLPYLGRRSKTDQEGQGSRVALPWGSQPETCPVRAYRDWIRISGITAGAVFHGLNNRCGFHCED
jgi:hypothetical protein